MRSNFYPFRPIPHEEVLKQYYVGKDIGDVPKPAVVLDVAIIKKHCERMLQTVKALGVGFRAHVKTHKVLSPDLNGLVQFILILFLQTTQIAQLQVGHGNEDANFVASTVLEIEWLALLLKDFKLQSRRFNILYGIPLVPSQTTWLAKIARELGPGSVSVMIDHPGQIEYLKAFQLEAGFSAHVFVKVDCGYHRAGLPPAMLNKNGLLEKLAEAEKEGYAVILGVYSHNSLSYGGSTPDEAMEYLTAEIVSCREAIKHNSHLLSGRELVISVGATPQVVSSNNLLGSPYSSAAEKLKNLLHNPSESSIPVKVELHAGVYPVLDMQQFSTNARHSAGKLEEEVAISVLAEVCSLYNDGERYKPEALVAAGSLALGREPCKAYPGWGVVSDWRREPGNSRLIVERISQEHAILAWEDGGSGEIPLEIGQSVRVYPNHACVTGAMYGWYLVVDSSEDRDASKIVDVWVRIGGW